MCIEYIISHINQLQPTEIFTTRHMLVYGSRTAVDSALSRLTAKGYLIRLAKGVFARDLSTDLTLEDIVVAKIKGYGGSAVSLTETFDNSMEKALIRTFFKTGSSTSFDTIKGKAVVKSQCARKMKLQGTKVGDAAVTLWQLGSARAEEDIDALTGDFVKIERETFRLSPSLTPAWLRKICARRFSSPRVVLNNPFL